MPTVKVVTINGSGMEEEILQLGQVVQIRSGTVASISGTTSIPFDNTSPLVSEGFQILSLSITPVSANSRFIFTLNLNLDHSNNNRNISAAVFLNGAINQTFSVSLASAGRPVGLPLHLWFETLTLTPFTLSVRLGADGAGTTYLGNSPAANLGGSRSANYTLLEVLNA